MADIFKEDFNSSDEYTEVEEDVFNLKDNELFLPLEDESEDVNQNSVSNDCTVTYTEELSVISLRYLAESSLLHNKTLAAKKILCYINEAVSDKDELHSILSVMCNLSQDEEAIVRTELIEHIPPIASFCREHGSDLDYIIRQHLVPIIVKLLTDNDIQVRKAAHASLLVLVEQNLIDFSQLSEWICPLISQIAITRSDVDMRMEGLLLMSKMIPLVGKEITLKFFLEPFIALCETSMFFRRICALSFGDLCKNVGTEVAEHTLLPIFLDLCNDENTDIRKACAEVFVDVASALSINIRKEILPHFYISFLNDSNRWVYIVAFRDLGNFICTYADPAKTGLYYENGSLVYVNIDPFQQSSQDTKCGNTANISDDCMADFEIGDTINKSDLESEQTETDEANTNQNSIDLDVEQCKESTELNNHLLCLDTQNNESEMCPPSCETELSCDKTNEDELRPQKNEENSLSNHEDIVINYPLVNSSDLVEIQAFKDKFSSNVVNQDLNKNSEIIDNKVNNILNGNSTNNNYVEQSSNNVSDSNSESSLNVASNDGHSHLHMDNENVFNHFQFWRAPLPDVELDIVIDGNKKLAKYGGTKPRRKTNSSIYAINASQDTIKTTTIENSSLHSSKEPGLRMEIQTACINTVDPCNINSSTLNRKERIYFNCSFLAVDKPELTSYPMISQSSKSCESISIFDQDIVPSELLKRYLSMVEVDICDGEIIKYCAFSFPAVAYTLGRKYWPCIRNLCVTLASNMQWKVRKTIAAALHDLAIIVGSELTTRDLFPMFMSLLRDLDEVKLGAMMHLSDFLKHLRSYERKQFLPLAEELLKLDNDRNWRIRYVLTMQLKSAAELYSPSEVHTYFLPVALFLVEDRVWQVRRGAVELLAVLVRCFSDEPAAVLLRKLDEDYRQSAKWRLRQTYVRLCQELAVCKSLPLQAYVADVVPNLFALASDKVPNVRLAVSRCLALTLLPLDYLPCIQRLHYQSLLQVMYSLQSDADRDVQHFAHLSAEAFNVLPQKKLSPV